ncbi:YmfQ family protein [Thalassospira sp. MCCC 1A01428]|uniref:YmfQ family protein n=1 Tax=Thalassospira sp. MCCC 1A01428 TaxID=1470575 RepID=UPI000A1F9B90|nr:putative phage tail protein [Thalassospira sp. MCCC 1A01428]
MTDYDDRLEAYAETAAAALPPGAFWQGFRDYDGAGRDLLRAKAQTWLDVDLAAERLIAESQPGRASEMLADHETQVGLPDCCFQTLSVNIEDRRNAVLTRYRAQGGQRPQYFIDLAKSLGYDVTITESRPFVCGLSEIGGDSSGAAPVTRLDTIGADRFSWKVVVPEPRVTWFRCGSGVLGQDALATINRADDLECLLARYQPAQQDLTVSYRGIPEPIIDIDLRTGLPAGWQFTRNSFASYVNASGEIAQAGIDELRVQHDLLSLRKLGGRIDGKSSDLMTIGYNMDHWTRNTGSIVTRTANYTEGLIAGQNTAVRWKVESGDSTSLGSFRVIALNGASKYKLMLAVKALPGNETTTLRFGPNHANIDLNPVTGAYSIAYGIVWINDISVQKVNGFYLVKANFTVKPDDDSVEYDTFTLYNRERNTVADLAIDFYSVVDNWEPFAFLYGETCEADKLKIPLSSVAGWQDGEPFEITVSGWTAEGIGPVSQNMVSIDDGSSANLITAYRDSASIIKLAVLSDGAMQAPIAGPAVIGKHHLEIIAHIENNNFWFSVSVDGGAAITYGPDTSGTIPTGLTTIVLGDRSDGLRTLFGEIEKFKLRFLSTPA